MCLFATGSITVSSAECCYAECCISFMVMLNVIMLIVILLTVLATKYSQHFNFLTYDHFVILLTTYAISQPKALWEQYKMDMSEDFLVVMKFTT
jgi:hypothetical protein